MPLYVLNRNYTLRTTLGVITFEKDKPTWVVPHMEKEVCQIGGERVDGENPDLIEDEKQVVLPPSGDVRKDQIFAAFEMIIEKNDSKEFTGQGVPTAKAVEKLVGFEVERNEVATAWGEFQVAKSEV